MAHLECYCVSGKYFELHFNFHVFSLQLSGFLSCFHFVLLSPFCSSAPPGTFSLTFAVLSCWLSCCLTGLFVVQLMFAKSQGSVTLTLELLDTEEENSDEPAETEVCVCVC